MSEKANEDTQHHPKTAQDEVPARLPVWREEGGERRPDLARVMPRDSTVQEYKRNASYRATYRLWRTSDDKRVDAIHVITF